MWYSFSFISQTKIYLECLIGKIFAETFLRRISALFFYVGFLRRIFMLSNLSQPIELTSNTQTVQKQEELVTWIIFWKK